MEYTLQFTLKFVDEVNRRIVTLFSRIKKI